MVDGATWPKRRVGQRRYRLRLLNGCNSLALVLKFDDPNVKVWQVGTKERTGTVPPTGTVRGPEPWECGRKDAVLCLPGEATRVKATFSTPGQFVWHCHFVEYDDNEMMRPYRIGPRQTDQPGPPDAR